MQSAGVASSRWLAAGAVMLLGCSSDGTEAPPGPVTEPVCGELSSGYWVGLAASRDGSLIALQFASGRIDLHRGDDGARLRTVVTGNAYSMALLAGGELLVTQGVDGTRLWNTGDGSLVRDLGTGPTVVSPRGDLFLDAGSGRLLRVADGGLVRESAELRNGAVRFSGNGAYLVAAGPTFKMWEVDSGQERASFPHPHDPTDDAGGPAVSDDGAWMAMAYEKATVLWRVADGQSWQTGGWEDGELAFSPDGRYLVFTDEGFQLWPLAPDGPGALRAMSTADTRVLAGGDRLFTLSQTSLVTAQVLDGPVTWSIEPELSHRDGVLAVSASRDGRRLLSADTEELFVWEAAGTGPTRIGPVRQTAAALSPDGKTIATGVVAVKSASFTGDASLTLRDASTGAVRDERAIDSGARTLAVDHLEFSRDGARLLFSTRRVTDDAFTGPGAPPSRWQTHVHDTSGWQPLIAVGDLEGPGVLSPDNRLLATATAEAIRLHDAQSGAVVREAPQPCPTGRRSIRPSCGRIELAFSPDGRWLVVSALGRVSILEAATLSTVRVIAIDGLVEYVRGLAISPDSRRLAIEEFAIVSLEDGAPMRSLAPPRSAPALGASAFTFLENRPALLVGESTGVVRVDCE